MTEWHQKDATNNRISKDDLKMFGTGWYKDASEDIQTKWRMAMFDYLPKVNGKYATKKIQRSKKLLEVTTVSDEALVLWLLHCYVETWEEEVCKDWEMVQEETDEDEDTTPNKKSSKKQGKHHSVSELKTFMSMLERVATRRRDMRGEAQSWEEALKEAAITPTTNIATATDGETTAMAILKPAKEKEKFVMPYY